MNIIADIIIVIFIIIIVIIIIWLLYHHHHHHHHHHHNHFYYYYYFFYYPSLKNLNSLPQPRVQLLRDSKAFTFLSRATFLFKFLRFPDFSFFNFNPFGNSLTGVSLL